MASSPKNVSDATSDIDAIVVVQEPREDGRLDGLEAPHPPHTTRIWLFQYARQHIFLEYPHQCDEAAERPIGNGGECGIYIAF